MSQPSRVIYLPPGVSPAPVVPQPAPQPQQTMPVLVPFDRSFFEQVLPGAIAAFSGQVACDQPLVQLLTVDGAVHYVKGLAGLSDAWVALHTQSPETDDAVEMFVPYQTIFRVSIHPCEDHNRQLGFVLKPQKVEVRQPRKRTRTVAKAAAAKS